MGRPRKKLPPNGLDIIRQSGSNGVSKRLLARALGMGVDAFNRILEDEPEAREAWEEAKAIEEAELHSLLMSMARGTPAEYDAAGNLIRAEQPRQLRAVEILWKSRHGYREQGDPPTAHAIAAFQFVMPTALPPEVYRQVVGQGQQPTTPASPAPLTHRG